MLFETIGQYRIFLWMFAAGMLIGAWYGLIAGLRRLMCAGVWLGLACDALFGLGAAAIFCLSLYAANYAVFRLYAALASALGFTVFALGAWPAARRIVCTLKHATRRIKCHYSACA